MSAVREEKEIKGHTDWKGRSKILFPDFLIVYIEDSKLYKRSVQQEEIMILNL